MNVLTNRLSQNWRNYDKGIKVVNPLKDGVVRKMGGKRKGVIPNTINSGREMTFTTTKRNNFSMSLYYMQMADFATLAEDSADRVNKGKVENNMVSRVAAKNSSKKIKAAQDRIKSPGGGSAAYKKKKREDAKDTLRLEARQYSDTPYNQRMRGAKVDKTAKPEPAPAPTASKTTPATDESRTAERQRRENWRKVMDSDNDAPKAKPVTMKDVAGTPDTPKATPVPEMKVNVNPKPKVKGGGGKIGKIAGAVVAAGGAVAGGKYLYDNYVGDKKKKKSGSFSYMSNIIEL